MTEEKTIKPNELSRRGLVAGGLAVAALGGALWPAEQAAAEANPFAQLWNPWGNATDLNLNRTWAAHLPNGGLDYNVAWKTPMRAPHSGVVSYRTTGGCGQELRIKHSSGYSSTFFHLYDHYILPSYSTPSWVEMGDYIARSGGRKWVDAAKTIQAPEWPSLSGSLSSGAHVHWHLEKTIDGIRTDPRPWINFSGPGGVPIPQLQPQASPQLDSDDTMILIASGSSSDGLIQNGYYYMMGADGPLRSLSTIEGGIYVPTGPYPNTPRQTWAASDIRALVKIVGLRATGPAQGLPFSGGIVGNDGRLTGAIIY